MFFCGIQEYCIVDNYLVKKYDRIKSLDELTEDDFREVDIIAQKMVLILGNGFSIDLISTIGKNDIVNLSNLFWNGDKVPWPADDIPGFLSQKNCPELWRLGARPNSNMEVSIKIIEDIITCANVSAMFEKKTTNDESLNIYIRAYYELVAYLKYLFIYYNNIISDKVIKKKITSWGWSKLLKNLNNNKTIESVTIITYNYDIFLERVLRLMGIKYNIVGLEKDETKFRLIKPHGSISFRSKELNKKELFAIKYSRGQSAGTLENLVLDEKVDFNKISTINTMIPPAGESQRYKFLWSKTLRDKVLTYIEKCSAEDTVIFGGLSYCGVDRAEIDGILTNLDNQVNINIINPDTENTFGAVISSVFERYIHYTDSKIIGGLYRD